MNKFSKNIKLSFDIINIKSVTLTATIILTINVIANLLPRIFSSDEFVKDIFLRVLSSNLLLILAILTVTIISSNAYRGAVLLKSFSVDNDSIKTYFRHTTLFYSISICAGLLLIESIMYNFVNLEGIFMFGYHLESITFTPFIKISLYIFAPILTLSLLTQVYTFVGIKYGILINLSIIITSIAGFLFVLMPIVFAVRYGVDANAIFIVLYVLCLLLFMVNILLTNKIEIPAFSLRHKKKGLVLIAIALSILGFSIYNLVDSFQKEQPYLESSHVEVKRTDSIDTTTLFNAKHQTLLDSIIQSAKKESTEVGNILIVRKETVHVNSTIKRIDLILKDNQKSKEQKSERIELIMLDKEAMMYYELSYVEGSNSIYDYRIKSYTGDIIYEATNITKPISGIISLPAGIYFQEVSLKNQNNTKDKEVLNLSTFIKYE